MNVRVDFEQTFGAKAFLRPLFYQYPGGIRFELSEGDSPVDQFLSALNKAQAICGSAFLHTDTLAVVLCARVWRTQFGYRSVMRDLRRAGVKIPKERYLWSESIEAPVAAEDDDRDAWIRVAFQMPKNLLSNLLWCALSQDLGIEPSPGISVYLADIRSQILVFPYDDRGMDVVGPNHERLSAIYSEFRSLTLKYDKARMEATFNAV